MHWLSLAHRCFFYYFWSNYLLYKFWEVEVFYKFLQPWIWVYLFSKFYGSRQYFCQEISIFLLCWISIDLLSFCEIIFLVHTWDGKWKRECIFSHFIILPQYFNNLYFAIVCVVGLYFFNTLNIVLLIWFLPLIQRFLFENVLLSLILSFFFSGNDSNIPPFLTPNYKVLVFSLKPIPSMLTNHWDFPFLKEKKKKSIYLFISCPGS